MVHKIQRSSKYYDEKSYSNDIENLDLILKGAKMSDALKNAVIELKDALEKKDYDRAYELSAVKSLIVGDIKPIVGCLFREDSKHNEKMLGKSLYGYLDGLHHKISFNLMRAGKDVIPSGAMIIKGTTTGLAIRQKGLPKLESPSLKRIKIELEQIRKDIKKMR